MRKIIFILLALPLWSSAQDIHYTQVDQIGMLQNPAFTGLFQGWERIAVQHRSQWVNIGSKFHTTTIAVDANFFKPKRGNKAHLGAGLVLFNDIGGDSKFGTKQMAFNFSAIVPVAEMHTLSAGLQFGMGQRKGDLTNLNFGNQFNGQEFDPNTPSNEFNGLVSKMYLDLGLGLNYRYGNHKLGFARDDATDFRIGFSYFHLNSPDISYRLGFTEKLYGKWAISTSFLKDISGSPVGFKVMFNQFVQGPHSETIAGALLRYRLSTGSKTTGLTRDTYLMGGLNMRFNDAIAPVIEVQWAGFNFGASYDITVSKLGNVSRRGGMEFYLSFTNFDFALFKRRRR